tara:strand:+ start:330 stop:1292 length:963 start_codon:yes stop_codon:yes gene_type:complete
MAVYKNTSCKPIIRKVMRDLKPNNADWVLDAVEWVGEALEHIGASSQLVQKQTVLSIKDNKHLLPEDLYYINQVAVNESVSPSRNAEVNTLVTQIKELRDDIREYNANVEDKVNKSADGTYTSSITTTDLATYDTNYKSNILELRELQNRMLVLQNIYFGKDGSTLQPLKYGASTFHKSIHCDECVNEHADNSDSYIIDGDYIKTSFATGSVCLSYMAFPTDDDCYPMVPDDISYKEAMFWYIYKQLLLGGFDKPNNKIDYNFADQKWKFYCTQARNAANYPDIDKYESYMNQWVRLVPSINRHAVFFEDLNERETLYRG